MYDIVIKNGYVADGTNSPWTKMDIAILNGRIKWMGRNTNVTGLKEINAEGCIVSPGFIDTHVHSDLLCTRPAIHKIKLKQGVTTELLGQDGISVAPVSSQTKQLWREQLKGLNGDIGDWAWNSVREYLTFLQKQKLLNNVAYLVPHGNVRTLVMGFEDRQATREEIKEMRLLVEKGLEEGAVGFSTGLIYPPNVYSTTEELIEICKGVAKYDGCFVVHMRNESFNILQAVEEMLEVAIKSGVRLHISHLKVIGKRNRQFYSDVLQKLEDARSQGVEVTFDQYPYTAGSTVFHAILPPWVHDGGTRLMIERLKDPVARRKIKRDLQKNMSYENWVLNCGWENIVISSVGSEQNKRYEGKSLEEIGFLKKQDPADAAFDLLIEEKGNVSMVVHWGLEEDIVKAMKSPYHIVGSDSIFGGKPHPRLAGTHPRIFSRYVREQRVLRLEEAVNHMTGAPAQLLRLKERGLLRNGYWADIVIFDPEEIADRATYDNPTSDPRGIRYVLVNGKICVEEGVCDIEGNGKVLTNHDRWGSNEPIS